MKRERVGYTTDTVPVLRGKPITEYLFKEASFAAKACEEAAASPEGPELVVKPLFLEFADDEFRDEDEEYGVVLFVAYHYDERDRTVYISKAEYEQLLPHSYKLSNGSWPNEVSDLVSEVQDREEASAYMGDLPTIEVAVC